MILNILKSSAKQSNALFLIMLALVTALVSCRTTVPVPSKTINTERQSTPYNLHNNTALKAMNVKTIHFVDLNNDGNLDALLGGDAREPGFHIAWNKGLGDWISASGPSTFMQPLSFAVSDINHNGKNDILIGGEGAQSGLQIWEYNSTNQHWSLHSTPITNGIFSSVVFADINNDGWDDIIASRMGTVENGGVVVLLNNTKGGWVSGLDPATKGIFTSMIVEDMNNDGNLDIIASARGGLGAKEDNDEVWQQVGGVKIWYGDGNGRWKPAELPAIADAESLAVTDIDGDGDLDILAGLYQKGITVWLNSNNIFHPKNAVKAGTWSKLSIGDLDANGQKEVIASSSIGQGIHIWTWHGSAFQEMKNLTPNFGTYADIEVASLNNDGLLSIAATRTDSGLEIWNTQNTTPLPLKRFMGEELSPELLIDFKNKSTQLSTNLAKWASNLKVDLKDIYVELTEYPYITPKAEIALKSQTPAIQQWLIEHGMESQNIILKPSNMAYDSDSTSGHKVLVQAYRVETSRLPQKPTVIEQNNLFEISENEVFKTIQGIPEYKIGAGDELSITFWQGAKADIQKVIVQIDGTISLPYQAALKVVDKTSREIDSLITNILMTYERNPRVDVQLLKARSKQASIFGEVQSLSRQPTGAGMYVLDKKESIVDFLSRAGGATKDANLNNVQIIRGGKTIHLNLNRAILESDLSENAIIDNNDTIFIPSLAQSQRQVYVLGEVNKTGIVEFTNEISFLDAISKSGGLKADAYLPDIRVLRASRSQPEILAVDFERFMETGDLSQNLALMDKDIIIIPARPIANWNKFISDISPSVTLLLQPVSIAQQILTLRLLSGQLK